MHIKTLQIENILSIENATIEFGETGLVLVDGWNFDDNRANGAGKSAIFNALSFALYGQVPRKITISQILRRGAKCGFASVSVDTPRGTYTVKRSRPSAVEYKLNDQPVDITQEEFEQALGLSYEQFQISLYSTQAVASQTPRKFLQLNDRDKKEFILSLMDLNFFKNCEKEANINAKLLETNIQQKRLELQGYISKIQAYSESIVDEVEVRSAIQLYQEEIQGYEKQVKAETIDRPDLSKFDEIEQKIQEKRVVFSKIRQDIAVLRSQYNEKKRLDVAYVARQPDANCPACNTPLSITGTRVACHEDESGRIAQHNEFRAKLQEDMQRVAQSINTLEDQLVAERELDKLESQIKQKKQDSLRTYDSSQNSRRELERAIQQRLSKIESLQQSLERSQVLSKNISDLKKTAKDCKLFIENSEKEVEVIKAAAAVFAPSGAPAYIMDSVVESFNDCVSRYVQMVWPNATYSLNTFKTTKKDTTLKAEFSESLEIGGKDVSIGSLSGGEARALSLAADFAIVDVLSRNFSVKINPIILDEPFDGLDSAGRETVVDLLEQLSAERQIWVVDHASESKALFSNIIRVEKRGGISNIVS